MTASSKPMSPLAQALEPLGELGAQLLALHPLLDPPHRVIGLVDVGDRLAETGEVVELPLLHGLSDAVVGDQLDGTAGETALFHRGKYSGAPGPPPPHNPRTAG